MQQFKLLHHVDVVGNNISLQCHYGHRFFFIEHNYLISYLYYYLNILFIIVSSFLSQIPEAIMNHLNYVSAQLRMSKSDLCHLLKSLNEAVSDQEFIKQVLDINDNITAMSADN